MKTLYDNETFEHNGHRFRVHFDYDDWSSAPWEDYDGHGPVRKENQPHRNGYSTKRPGERPLNRADRNEYQFYYDWQEAMRIAKRDGWNTAPYDAPNKALRAVQADFDYLSAWCNNEWQYVIVTVDLMNDNGETIESDSIGMVESWKDYDSEIAYQIADALIHQHQETLRKEKIAARFSDAMACGV